MRSPGPVVAIVGPTASGKSALADAVALRLSSEVVSVDAMQVYRGMDIGTAKTPLDKRPVPLRMVDVCEAGDDYSVQLFQRGCREVVDGLLAAGRTPVLCGGTGLYLNAVIDDMRFPSGEKGSSARSPYEAIAEEQGPQALFSLLLERDPKSAELIHPNNVRRVVRALEMLDEGVSYAEHHKGLHQRKAHYEALICGLTMPRELLYERIEQRVDQMIRDGLVEEVRGLWERGLLADTTSGQAIGYKEIVGYLEGSSTLEAAIDSIKVRTRHYAKRQISWFKNDGRVKWIDISRTGIDEAAEGILGALPGPSPSAEERYGSL